MVEHAVHDDLLAAGVAVGHELPELLVGAEAAVHPAVVDGIVAVGAALKQRADIDGRAADVCRVLCPVAQFFERPGHCLTVIFVCASAQSQRIDVIEYRIVIPSHCYYRSRLLQKINRCLYTATRIV